MFFPLPFHSFSLSLPRDKISIPYHPPSAERHPPQLHPTQDCYNSTDINGGC